MTEKWFCMFSPRARANTQQNNRWTRDEYEREKKNHHTRFGYYNWVSCWVFFFHANLCNVFVVFFFIRSLSVWFNAQESVTNAYDVDGWLAGYFFFCLCFSLFLIRSQKVNNHFAFFFTLAVGCWFLCVCFSTDFFFVLFLLLQYVFFLYFCFVCRCCFFFVIVANVFLFRIQWFVATSNKKLCFSMLKKMFNSADNFYRLLLMALNSLLLFALNVSSSHFSWYWFTQ